MEVGRDYGIVNFGQSTLNMMRIENGYKIWGREVCCSLCMIKLFAVHYHLSYLAPFDHE